MEVQMTYEPAAQFPWFALQVRTRHEKGVATLLRAEGYECFLPLYKCKRRWSDRIKQLELPLFPGYLFCRFNPQNRLPILMTPGVGSIVGIGKKPVPVNDAELAAVETIMQSGLLAHPWPFLRAGQPIRIECGALHGLEGILLEFKGNYRIVVSITLLQRSVAVEIDSTWVSPLSRTCVRPFGVDTQIWPVPATS